MAWHPVTILRVLAPVALLACGGGGKKTTTAKTTPTADVKPPVPPPETEADRDKKRHAEAVAIVPEGSSCLPVELKNGNAPKLELAVIDSGAVVCAIDQERTRLLGPVGCWNIDVKDPARMGALTYQPAAPLPGRGFSVMFDDRCARGYCLPPDAKVPADSVALMTWNLDNSKVAVLAGSDVHIFDAAKKEHEKNFSIHPDKGGVTGEPTAVHWNGDASNGGMIFVETSDVNTSAVWVFKSDGTPVGPIEALGGKDKALLSTRNGSFMMLDRTRVAISEQGLSALTVYESDTGKRTKSVRKLPASTCKKDELEALWHDPAANLSPKCKEYVTKNYEHLIGADAIAGSKNLLVLLRGPRLGELAVIDPKTLAERKAIKMPWCDANGGGAEKASAAAPAASKEDKAPEKASAKKAAPAPKSKGDAAEDPDAGGQ
jgi:hypothetical protein